MPIRLNFIVEGQTEETFVNQTLSPHLADLTVYARARCVMTSQKGGFKYRGGLSSYAQAKADVARWMNEDQNFEARFTTMFDLYALPEDFPGYEVAMRERDPYVRVERLEDALYDDISDWRFVPYIQLHEFEALLFADPTKLNEQFECDSTAFERLVEVSERCNPELIDDGSDTAPSKRIISEIPEYKHSKASAGPIVARQIGLTVLRAKCTHFSAWLDKLEALE